MMASPKRLKAHELDFGDLGLHDRAHSIMTHWLPGLIFFMTFRFKMGFFPGWVGLSYGQGKTLKLGWVFWVACLCFSFGLHGKVT